MFDFNQLLLILVFFILVQIYRQARERNFQISSNFRWQGRIKVLETLFRANFIIIPSAPLDQTQRYLSKVYATFTEGATGGMVCSLVIICELTEIGKGPKTGYNTNFVITSCALPKSRDL